MDNAHRFEILKSNKDFFQYVFNFHLRQTLSIFQKLVQTLDIGKITFI